VTGGGGGGGSRQHKSDVSSSMDMHTSKVDVHDFSSVLSDTSSIAGGDGGEGGDRGGRGGGGAGGGGGRVAPELAKLEALLKTDVFPFGRPVCSRMLTYAHVCSR
jgi:hypothetical protein